MRFRRVLAAVAAVTMAILLLTGCGTDPGYDNDSPPGYIVHDVFVA